MILPNLPRRVHLGDHVSYLLRLTQLDGLGVIVRVRLKSR